MEFSELREFLGAIALKNKFNRQVRKYGASNLKMKFNLS
jgi:hypothetical protein